MHGALKMSIVNLNVTAPAHICSLNLVNVDTRAYTCENLHHCRFSVLHNDSECETLVMQSRVIFTAHHLLIWLAITSYLSPSIDRTCDRVRQH